MLRYHHLKTLGTICLRHLVFTAGEIVSCFVDALTPLGSICLSCLMDFMSNCSEFRSPSCREKSVRSIFCRVSNIPERRLLNPFKRDFSFLSVWNDSERIWLYLGFFSFDYEPNGILSKRNNSVWFFCLWTKRNSFLLVIKKKIVNAIIKCSSLECKASMSYILLFK